MLSAPTTIDLFTKYGVFSEAELASRQEIYLEQYVKTITTEAKLVIRMARTVIFPAAMRYQGELAGVAANHTRAMANQNFFDHIDRDGRTPGDRAELAGYLYQQIGENIAAGRDTAHKVVDGWLDSPGHCATLMNADFRELGAAYAVHPKSDAGIYWTGLFGTPQ